MKNRKVIYSFTIDPSVPAKALALMDKPNFSEFVRQAVKEKIERLEQANKK